MEPDGQGMQPAKKCLKRREPVLHLTIARAGDRSCGPKDRDFHEDDDDKEDAKGKADQALQEKTQEMMGGLSLPPGMKLPF